MRILDSVQLSSTPAPIPEARRSGEVRRLTSLVLGLLLTASGCHPKSSDSPLKAEISHPNQPGDELANPYGPSPQLQEEARDYLDSLMKETSKKKEASTQLEEYEERELVRKMRDLGFQDVAFVKTSKLGNPTEIRFMYSGERLIAFIQKVGDHKFDVSLYFMNARVKPGILSGYSEGRALQELPDYFLESVKVELKPESSQNPVGLATLDRTDLNHPDPVIQRGQEFIEARSLSVESPELKIHDEAGLVEKMQDVGLITSEMIIESKEGDDSIEYTIFYEGLFFKARIKAVEGERFNARAYPLDPTGLNTKEEWGSCDEFNPEKLVQCLLQMAKEHLSEEGVASE